MDPERRRRNEETLAADYAEVSREVLSSLSHHPNWEDTKRFIKVPVSGDGQYGAVLADMEAAVARDSEKDFWETLLVGARMLRRQAHPMGQKTFGEEQPGT